MKTFYVITTSVDTFCDKRYTVLHWDTSVVKVTFFVFNVVLCSTCHVSYCSFTLPPHSSVWPGLTQENRVLFFEPKRRHTTSGDLRRPCLHNGPTQRNKNSRHWGPSCNLLSPLPPPPRTRRHLHSLTHSSRLGTYGVRFLSPYTRLFRC